ncbi:MAG TPA: type II toxin-antitoxin system prevent-host-death family antitoxin [Burkholderiaceae bacterium]|nr:type II toxin-antitoxin system prevent-host-death family antitoxin [Burkholderiaceae bacterium]
MGAYSVAAAKAHLSEILKHVQAGAKVTIAKRGQPVAEIVPAQQRLRKAIDWKAVEAFRKTLPRSRTSAARLLRRMRAAGF